MQSFSASALALILPFASAAKYYSSGEVKTHDAFRYGKFTARMQASDEYGTVGSLFTYWGGDADTPWSVAGWNEIDVEIVPSLADQNGAFWTNIISAGRTMDGQSIANFNPGNEWHVYEIEW